MGALTRTTWDENPENALPSGFPTLRPAAADGAKPARIYIFATMKDLTSGEAGLKYREIPANPSLSLVDEEATLPDL